MPKYLTVKEAAPRLGVTVRRVRQMCQGGELRGARKRNFQWEIATTGDVRLIRAELPAVRGEHANLDGVSPEKREEALRKYGIIRICNMRVAEYVRNGGKADEAATVCAAEHDIERSTLYRWRAKYREHGLRGLVDTRGRRRSDYSPISAEAFEHFKSLYLRPQQPSLRLCWQMVRYVNTSENKGWTVPDYKPMCEYAEEHIPYPYAVLHREGLEAYNAKCAPYIMSDPDSIEPGELWIGDHHELNLMIRHRSKWVRPWITGWEDMKSRMLVGWHFSVQPNQTTVLRAMKPAVEEHGPPEWAKIDNGKDYDSQMWTGETKGARRRRKKLGAGYLDERMFAGLYGLLGVTVSFAIVYNARAKRIERFFDTMDRQFCKTLPTYCGKDAGRKPEELNEYLKTGEAVQEAHNLESFAEVAGRYIEAYNNTPHTGAGMDGQTPAQVMASRSSRVMLQEGVLDLLMRVWSGQRTVGRNGVKFRGMWFGQYDQKLWVHQGDKVRVSYDADDLRYLYVYDAVTFKLITIAEQARLMAYGAAVSDEDLREAMRKQRHAQKIARQFRNSRLVANMDLTDLAIAALAEGKSTEADEESLKHRTTVVTARRTPLDGQVATHRRELAQRKLKKAVGAESMEVDLELDFSLLRQPDEDDELIDLEFPWHG